MVGVDVSHLSKTYGDGSKTGKVLQDVSFEVNAGQFSCILGPSGCGKTTLLNVIAGLIVPDSGSVAFPTVGDVPSRRPRLGYVFQQHRLLPWKTVEGNLGICLDALGMARAQAQERVTTCLAMVGLEAYRTMYPGTLSEGMRQRVAIARALVVEPELFLMDEPLSHLDELTARALRRELVTLWHSAGRTVVYVTHNSLEAAYLADQVVVLTAKPCRVANVVRIANPRPRQFEDPGIIEMQKHLLDLLGVK